MLAKVAFEVYGTDVSVMCHADFAQHISVAVVTLFLEDTCTSLFATTALSRRVCRGILGSSAPGQCTLADSETTDSNSGTKLF